MDILLSTAYLPPVGYFSEILKGDRIYIEKHETYVKQTYRNRSYIYSPNGKQILVIPVSKPSGNRTAVSEILLSNVTDWQRQHWRAIETAYNSSPFFLYYRDEIYPFFNNKFENLLEFNTQLLLKIMEMIGVKKEIQFTSSFEHKPEDKIDLRYSLSPKKFTEAGFSSYTQVFSQKSGFIANLSIIDLIFNMGPDSLEGLVFSVW